MRKVLLAAALPLFLTGCVSALSTASAVLPLITSSLDAACASSTALATQAASQPALKGASVLVKVNNAVAGVCGKIDPTSAAAGSALNTLNTLTAQLLGVAGAAGINLPGIK